MLLLRVHLLIELFLFVVLAEHFQSQASRFVTIGSVSCCGCIVFLLNTSGIVLALAVLRGLDVPSILPSLIFHIHYICFRRAQACVRLEGILFAELVRCHVSVYRSSHSRPTSTAVFSIMSIQAASISCFSVPSLDLLINEIFKILLPYKSLFVLYFVLRYVLSRLIVPREHELHAFVNFGVFVEFYSPNVMCVQHISVKASDLICAVLALNIFSKYFNVPTNFSDEGISRTLKNQTYIKIRIILFFLQTGVC